MIDNNPLRIDFYERYQEIIDAYNREKIINQLRRYLTN